MSKTINTTWLPLFYGFLLSIILCFPAAQQCEQCKKPAIWEALLAHAVGDSISVLWFDMEPLKFLHSSCADAWMKDHPLELDEDGRIITVYDPRHSRNK